ncbi:MAG TPA: hypothetical protein GX708_05405 [Gallicola sp.]|nr:hypothetical protein [Gallicola sp.]
MTIKAIILKKHYLKDNNINIPEEVINKIIESVISISKNINAEGRSRT